MYEGWAHTDAILEGPLTGDNALCEDIITQIRRVFPNSPISTTAESSSSRASFDASGNFLSSSSTTNSQSNSHPTRARSRTNSIPQSLIHLTTSVSTDDLFPSNFIENMSEQIPVSVLKGNGTALIDARDEVWARAVCSRCSLRYCVGDQNGHSNYHDTINDLLEQNGRFDGRRDQNPNNLLDDTEMRDKNTFISKCESRVSHAIAVSVSAPLSEAPIHGNGNDILPGTDHRCFGSVLLPTQEVERHCICHGTHTDTNAHNHPNEEMLATALNCNRNKRKKGDIGAQSCDNFADCRVPLLLVGVARWVNPF